MIKRGILEKEKNAIKSSKVSKVRVVRIHKRIYIYIYQYLILILLSLFFLTAFPYCLKKHGSKG